MYVYTYIYMLSSCCQSLVLSEAQDKNSEDTALYSILAHMPRLPEMGAATQKMHQRIKKTAKTE
jgi:hypothetical protein